MSTCLLYCTRILILKVDADKNHQEELFEEDSDAGNVQYNTAHVQTVQ